MDYGWLTSNVLATIKRNQILWARWRRSPNILEPQNEFVTERNRFTALLQAENRTYLNAQFLDARSNIAKTWSFVH